LLFVSVSLRAQQVTPPPPIPAPTAQSTPPADTATSTKPPATPPTQTVGPTKPPRVLHTADASFTEDAEKHCIQGKVSVQLVVDTNGNPTHIVVMHGLGYGLDVEAIKAVRQYKFQPATRDGEPVPAELWIEIDFQHPYCH
jgi:TonB family protein